MKRVQVLVCLCFVVSCAVFAGYTFKTHMVEDNVPPVITCEQEEITVSVQAEETELLKGVKASDDHDGDISSSVRISSKSHFIAPGKRTVEYVVFDKANHAGIAKRTLCYSDYTPPRIFMNKPLRYSLSQVANANFLENVTAQDCLDGDVSKQIRTSVMEPIYDLKPGEYGILFQVSNSAGDICKVPVTVQVIDPSDRAESQKCYPVLSEYIVYTKVNQQLDLNQYLTGVAKGNTVYTFAQDGDQLKLSAEDIAIHANVNYGAPGVYTVDYVCASEDYPAALTRLYVVVEE